MFSKAMAKKTQAPEKECVEIKCDAFIRPLYVVVYVEVDSSVSYKECTKIRNSKFSASHVATDWLSPRCPKKDVQAFPFPPGAENHDLSGFSDYVQGFLQDLQKLKPATPDGRTRVLFVVNYVGSPNGRYDASIQLANNLTHGFAQFYKFSPERRLDVACVDIAAFYGKLKCNGQTFFLYCESFKLLVDTVQSIAGNVSFITKVDPAEDTPDYYR